MRPSHVVERWIRAINTHDFEEVVVCFASDYEDEAPARRGELVRGRAQVRENFERLFAGMPGYPCRASSHRGPERHRVRSRGPSEGDAFPGFSTITCTVYRSYGIRILCPTPS